jgi:predicted phosphodiesterase
MAYKKFVAFSCPHCPLQDKEAVDWLLGRIDGLRPDVVVHLGDGHEADSASRWPSEYTWGIKDEFKAHNAFLRDIRKVTRRGTRLVFLPGNHDDNFQAVGRLPDKLRGALDYRDAVHEPELAEHWEIAAEYDYHRTRGVFRLGQVAFAHGYEAGVNADKFHAVMLADPGGLYVGGHLHRPTMGIQRASLTAAVPLPYWYANPGCLRNLSPQYMRRQRKHNWGQGLVHGECNPLARGRIKPDWKAHVEIFRMSDAGE